MIYIQRKLQPPELNLTNPNSIGYKELEDAKKQLLQKIRNLNLRHIKCQC